MSDILKKYYEDMSDREIMDSKRIKNIAEDEINQTVKIFEEEYPELSKEWHPTKNGQLTPFLCTKRSNKNVWWQCPMDRDHVYKQTIKKHTKRIW